MFTQEQVKTCLLVLPVATVFLSIGICDHMVLSVSQTGTSTVSSCYLPIVTYYSLLCVQLARVACTLKSLMMSSANYEMNRQKCQAHRQLKD